MENLFKLLKKVHIAFNFLTHFMFYLLISHKFRILTYLICITKLIKLMLILSTEKPLNTYTSCSILFDVQICKLIFISYLKKIIITCGIF